MVILRADEDTETVAASSDPGSANAADLEHALGEGPSRDALARGRPVLVGDLEGCGTVWVAYAHAAGAQGVRAVFSFPLQVGAARFGALTMYAGTPQRLGRTRTQRCLALAEIATETLLDSSDGVSSSRLEASLDGLLDLRVEVFQAQGMAMVTLRSDLATALARMRAHAYRTDRSLYEVSLDILAGRLTLTDERSDS
ncbi:GAF domain-containing protein [Nocardioides okcheonensis]|nr:GAF domain-containing protein [Nocardioides okcheonensis]